MLARLNGLFGILASLFWFWLCCIACGILLIVPQTRIDRGSWQRKCQILTTGPPNFSLLSLYKVIAYWSGINRQSNEKRCFNIVITTQQPFPSYEVKGQKGYLFVCPDSEDLGQSQDPCFILNPEQLVSEETGLSSTHRG